MDHRPLRAAMLAALLATLATVNACSARPDEDVASSDSALDACSRAKVTASAGLNLRREPSTDAETLTRLPHERVVEVLGASADGAWAKVRFGAETGWASREWLACATAAAGGGSASGPCPAGQTRHAYVHDNGADLFAEGAEGAPALFMLPYGQKLQVLPSPAGAFTKVSVPSLDDRLDGSAPDRVEGFVRSSAVKHASNCRPDGLLEKDRAGARHLLGQATIARAASSDNAKNMTLGFNRVDGAAVASDGSFAYLEYVADNNTGIGACSSDADCDGAEVCNQRGLCGPYIYGIGGGGGELWGSGVCGTATAIHRAALDAALLPTAYTNHDHYISSYEYVGVDAEVWWSGGAPGATGQHFKFFNDSGGSLVLVSSSRKRGSQLEATVQIWGTLLDARYSEHEVADLGEGRVELRRLVTRLGDARRVSPALTFEGTGNIRRLAETSATTADGRTATTEDWRIDSVYEGSIRLPREKAYSRHHPSRPR